MDDWRLMGQESYLGGRAFRMATWWPYRDGWDHDHCEFCQRHISLSRATDDADAVNCDYVTIDGYHWVCEPCFEDFKDQMRFSVVS